MNPIALINTPEVKACRQLDDKSVKFKIDGRRFLLIYETAKLNPKRVRAHLCILADSEAVEVVIFIEDHPEEGVHTYVLVDFHKRFQSSAVRLLDINRHHPTMLVVKDNTSWYNILSYFPPQDEAPEYVPEVEEERPLLELADMKHWQADVIRIMRENVRVVKSGRSKGHQDKDCKINVVLTKERCGRTTLIAALKRAKPRSICVVDGIVDTADLVQLEQISQRSWNRETLIINVGDTLDMKGLRAMYVFIEATLTKVCCDIWIFTSMACVFAQDRAGKAALYGMGRVNWDEGKVGPLIPVELPRSNQA